MLGFAAIATAAHAETYFFANSISFTDVTTVNGVPTFAGSQSGQPMRLIGTNPAGVEIVTGGNYTNFGGSWKISADGTKMNGNVFGTGTFGDGNAHSTMGRYDFTTSTWSEYGSNGFYTTVAPTRLQIAGVFPETGIRLSARATTTPRVAPVLASIRLHHAAPEQPLSICSPTRPVADGRPAPTMTEPSLAATFLAPPRALTMFGTVPVMVLATPWQLYLTETM